ncbi:MAG: ATP-binding protein [Hyphomicrobiaceae bacterium]
MKRLFDSMAGRMMLVLVLGLGLFHAASLLTYTASLNSELSAQDNVRLAERLVAIRNALKAAPSIERETLAHQMSGGPVDAHWGQRALAVETPADSSTRAPLKKLMTSLVPELTRETLRVGTSPPLQDGAIDTHLTMVSVGLGDGTWANVTVVNSGHLHGSSTSIAMATTLMAIGVMVATWLLVRWSTRPLRALADAAQQFSGSALSPPLSDTGPHEVREAATAFNGMQRRIRSLIQDRALSLAAISHDLKTPLTRLRFRVDDLSDQELKQSIADDIDEMEEMINGTIAFLRGEASPEDSRPLELRAILENICFDHADRGYEVSLSGSGKGILHGQSSELKRAFSNLIQNALKYGDVARVSITDAPGRVEVVIEDDGPGIPSEQLIAVFTPFYRVDQSRGRETGGVGLGLTVADRVVTAHEGTIKLTNTTPRGLRVVVTLPLAPTLQAVRSS